MNMQFHSSLEGPAEVRAVEVLRTVGQSSLMIGWERPPLDELGCSNGTFVYGYRVGLTNQSSWKGDACMLTSENTKEREKKNALSFFRFLSMGISTNL